MEVCRGFRPYRHPLLAVAGHGARGTRRRSIEVASCLRTRDPGARAGCRRGVAAVRPCIRCYGLRVRIAPCRDVHS